MKNKITYSLSIIDQQGSWQIRHNYPSNAEVRAAIRQQCVKGTIARVWRNDGQSIWDGPALSFK